MNTQRLLSDLLEARESAYRAKLKRCRRALSPKGVHDLRVLTRRLLALVELARAVAPPVSLQKSRKHLKAQLKNLNALRDTHMMLNGIEGSVERLPALVPFRSSLRSAEKEQLDEAAEQVAASRWKPLAKHLDEIRKAWAETPPSREQLLGEVDKAYLAVMRRYERITPLRPDSIHRTRVAFKEFRYMVEVIRPLLQGFPKSRLKRMRAYQSDMGKIQDSGVLLCSLKKFGVPKAALRHFEQRHTALISAYIGHKGDLVSFWRTNLRQPFSWEAKHEPLPRPSRNRSRARRPAR